MFIMEEVFNKEEIKKLGDKHGVKSINYIDYPTMVINGKHKDVFTYLNLENLFKQGGDIYLLKTNVYRGFNVL